MFLPRLEGNDLALEISGVKSFAGRGTPKIKF